VRKIILQLFPQIKGLFENTTYGSEWQDRWTKELRICSTELFERYFIMDVPEGEISQFEIDKLLSATSDKNVFAQLLEEYLKNGRIKKVLLRLEDYTDTFNLDYAQNIIIPLFDISDRLPEETVGFLDTDTDMHIMRIIYHYLKRVDDKAKRSAILKEAIKARGSSYSDYRDPAGKEGGYQKKFKAYQQTGKPCQKRDGGIIQKIKVGGRSGHFCPIHQRM